jgi:hypothetical protein
MEILAVWNVVLLPGTTCPACMKGTLQEPESSQASLSNVWHLLLLFCFVHSQLRKV